MKAKKIDPLEIRATINAEELLKEKGMTREEWNDLIAEKVKEIEADESLTPEQKDQRISHLLFMGITRNNRFLIEELVNEGLAGGDVDDSQD